MSNLYKKLLFLIVFTGIYALASAQQVVTINGKVTDESGEVIPGVNVYADHGNEKTITDQKGNFNLSVSKTISIIKFSYVGYITTSRNINLNRDKITLNVSLSPTKSDLQQVEITGRKEKTYKNTATFIGSKSEILLKDLPQSVSYASKELIADQGAVRVGEVVKNFSGVNQFTFYDDITIRGFRINGGSNTQLINGMRTSTGFWKQPLANYLERVEVLKGPSSALYGNASPGGVINRVTKKPLAETRKSLSLSMGSYNTFRALADVTGPANKDSTLLYRLNFGYEDANSFRDLQFDKNVVIAPSLTFLPSKNTSLNFDLVYNDSKSRLDRGQSVFGNGNLYSTPQSTSLNTGNDRLNEKTYNVALSLNHRFSDNLNFTASYMKTGYSEDLYEHRSANAYALDATGKPVDNLIAMQIFNRIRKRYIDNFSGFINYKIKTGKIEQTIVAGYDFASEKLPVGASQLTANNYRNAANTGAISFVKSDYDKDPTNYIKRFLVVNNLLVPNVPSFNLNDVMGSQRMQDDSKNFFTQAAYDPTYYFLHAGYVQDNIKFGKLQALVGLRYEYYTDFANYLKPTEAKAYSKALLPRFGLVYSATQNINLYGTYVMGYTPQTASAISNPNAGGPFDPLKSNMIEFGAKTSWMDDHLTASAAIYQIKQTNVLYPANVAGQPDLLRSVGEERSRGIEFDVIGRIIPQLSILASYSYNQAMITDSPVASEIGIQKPNAPHHTANIWAKYNFSDGILKGLGIGAGSNYVDSRILSLNFNQTIPSYTLFNAALYYNVGKVQVQFNMNNITNKAHWVGGYDYLRLFPGTPSNYLFTLGYTFN
ncbi:TonB-dependent receptor [Pedobacter sp. KBS0701]|uniref:TonB-dependent receptor n=1 Tax=Pedobacter sp. KBS0701 TaxID=2578106 RepID=UPI00110D630D|nr:TonB-dependent receptor [Pedobacter sp. KBS0701]QDW23827.1 TonB-dependent receptor [Pedobacter sp. KBS0701]